jgi:hypothetical protein
MENVDQAFADFNSIIDELIDAREKNREVVFEDFFFF